MEGRVAHSASLGWNRMSTQSNKDVYVTTDGSKNSVGINVQDYWTNFQGVPLEHSDKSNEKLQGADAVDLFSRHYKETISFDTHPVAKLRPLAILKKFKFCSKNPSMFSKEPKFWTFWEILLLQSHSTANLLHFGQKNSRSESWTNIGNVNTIGEHGVKKRTHLSRWFCSHIHIGACRTEAWPYQKWYPAQSWGMNSDALR